MLSLRWFVKGNLAEYAGGKTEVDGAHRLDDDTDYRPVRVVLHQRSAPSGNALIVDINNDGTSIFTDRPQMKDVQEKVWTTIQPNVIRGGSVLTMDIDQVSATIPGEDLTVQLDLEEA